MVYGDFKDFPKRAISDKLSHYKAVNFTENPKCDGY